MLAFLLRNPLASALGVVALVLAIGGVVQTVRLDVARADVAAAELKTAKVEKAFETFKGDVKAEALRVERDAAKAAAEQSRQLLEDFKRVGDVANQVKETVRYVQVAQSCERDPGVVSLLGGVSDILAAGSRAPGGHPAPLGGAAAPLPDAARAAARAGARP